MELEETGVPVGEGFRFSILGPHDAEVGDLLHQLRAHAEAEVDRQYLEPNPHRPGWVLAGDDVASRLVGGEGRDVGEPYDVVIDGRTLSWDELGRALQALRAGGSAWSSRTAASTCVPTPRWSPSRPRPGQSSATEAATGPERTIDEVLAEFLAAQEQRLAARTFANYRAVVELLRDCLNGYGHQYLDDHERVRFERASAPATRRPSSACSVPTKSSRHSASSSTTSWFVASSWPAKGLLRAAGTVTKKLAKWNLDAASAGEAVERGASAARDLLRAERLSRLLYEQAERAAKDDRHDAGDDIVEDYFTIERVEPGALWLTGGIGPIEVDAAASSLASLGWSVYLVLARSPRGWRILEAGNVYP